MGRGAQVVEVLGAEEFREHHLPGAINLPLRKIETEAGKNSIRPGWSSSTAGIRPET